VPFTGNTKLRARALSITFILVSTCWRAPTFPYTLLTDDGLGLKDAFSLGWDCMYLD